VVSERLEGTVEVGDLVAIVALEEVDIPVDLVEPGDVEA